MPTPRVPVPLVFVLVLVLVLLLALAPPARADTLDARSLLDAPADPFGYAHVQGARTLAPGHVHVALAAQAVRRPLVARPPGGPEAAIVEEIVETDLIAGAGVLPVARGSLALGAVLPVIPYEELRSPATGETARRASVGDLRTDVKLGLLEREDDFVGLAVRGWVEWPTGTRGRFIANDGRLAAGAEIDLELGIDFVRGGVALGYEWAEGDGGPAGPLADDALRLGGGFALAPLRDIAGLETLELAFEATHRTPAARPWDSEALSPVEVGGAIRFARAPGLFALLHGSLALNDGLGAAERRLGVAAGWTF